MALVKFDEVQSHFQTMLQETLRVELESLRSQPRNREDELLESLRSSLQTELLLHEDRLRKLILKSGNLMSTTESPRNAPRAPPAPPEALGMDSEENPSDGIQALPGLVEDEHRHPRASSPSGKQQQQQHAADHGEPDLAKVVPAPTSADKAKGFEKIKSMQAFKTAGEEDEDAEWIPSTGLGILLRILKTRVVQSRYFDGLIISCILLNSFSMGLQGDWGVSHIGEKEPSDFETIEYVFACIFSSELLLRIVVYNRNIFRRPDWRWTIFDCLIVGLQIFDIVSAAAISSEDTKSHSNANFSFFRVLRVLRLLRILRLVRILRFVSELRSMVMSIASSMRSLAWTLVLLFFVIYVVAIYLTQTIADRGFDDPSIAEDPGISQYYASLFGTMESLYQAITGGIDWNDLVEPLTARVSPYMQGVFILYISFAVLAMMNVVTGIFVESALQTTRKDEEKEMKRTLKDIFMTLDSEDDGSICYDEFIQHLNKPEVKGTFESLGFDVQEAARLFQLLDTDHSGNIDGQELLEGCLRLRGPASAMDVAIIQYSSKRVFEFYRGKFQGVQESLDSILHKLLEDSEPEKTPARNSCASMQVDPSKIFGAWKRPRSAEKKT
eukprot:TRINITY_DN20104_c0_g1_i1.p1 TRINITY_DN20104_c0_g1~~TRINITY_DN20104_c0_g1_i1.p1  ORF type:complete len:629 (-),score=109.30 TRINITY_DN20104_c0_g1_i1:89-1924(-)